MWSWRKRFTVLFIENREKWKVWNIAETRFSDLRTGIWKWRGGMKLTHQFQRMDTLPASVGYEFFLWGLGLEKKKGQKYIMMIGRGSSRGMPFFFTRQHQDPINSPLQLTQLTPTKSPISILEALKKSEKTKTQKKNRTSSTSTKPVKISYD